jgi:hypothetical protein
MLTIIMKSQTSRTSKEYIHATNELRGQVVPTSTLYSVDPRLKSRSRDTIVCLMFWWFSLLPPDYAGVMR